MMIIKSILLLIASTILIVKGQEGNVFLNFIPYTDSQCKNNEGHGISGLLNVCFTIDSINNWVFTSRGNEVTVTGYSNTDEITVCDSSELSYPTKTYKIGSCVSGKSLPGFDFNVDSIQPYYKLTITHSVPTIPSNSYTLLFTYAQCSSDNFKENTVAVEYYTNGTKVFYGSNNDETNLTFCNQSVAESITCIQGRCSYASIDDVTCATIGPFFNFNVSSSSNTDSNTGSNTGSNSWSNNASARASSSGFQINKNGDKNNILSQSSTGSGSVSSDSQSSWQSSSSSQTGYYLTIYCTPK